MATYKISYLENQSYSKKGSLFVDNCIDENDAIELAIYKYGLSHDATIIDVDLVCE